MARILRNNHGILNIRVTYYKIWYGVYYSLLNVNLIWLIVFAEKFDTSLQWTSESTQKNAILSHNCSFFDQACDWISISNRYTYNIQKRLHAFVVNLFSFISICFSFKSSQNIKSVILCKLSLQSVRCPAHSYLHYNGVSYTI